MRVFYRGRQANAAQVWAHCLQACQCQHKLITAFAFGKGVNLVNDHALHPVEHPRRIFVAREQRKRFRRCQKNVRRVDPLALFDVSRGVAGAILHTDRQAGFFNWRAQIAFDICRKCFEGADI